MLRYSEGWSLIQDVAQKTKSLVVGLVAARLEAAEQNIDFLTPAELYQFIDPNAVERSFEQEQSRNAPRLLFIRNFLFILPLILTLMAFWWASVQYRGYIELHPQDTNQPFLLLWETGFNTGNPLFTASTIVLGDVLVFLLGSIVAIVAWFQQLQGKQREQRLHLGLQRALAELSDSSLGSMKRLRNPNIAPNQAFNQINSALLESVNVTKDVQVQIVRVVEQMNVFRDNASFLSQSTNQLGQYVGNLEKSLVQFEEGSRESANRLEVVQDRNIATFTTLITRVDGIRINLDEFAQNILTALDNLQQLFNRTIQALNTTEGRLGQTASSFDGLGRSLTTNVEQFTQQMTQLTTTTQTAIEATRQLTDSQKIVGQSTQKVLERVYGIVRETSNSAGALRQLADTGADTARAASSLVTRLETIQQLLGRLVVLAATEAQGGSFLQGLFNPEQEEESLGANPLKILSLLQASGPQRMQALMRRVESELVGQGRLDPAVFADVIETFSDMDLVALSGKSGNELVKLTALGEQITGTLVSS